MNNLASDGFGGVHGSSNWPIRISGCAIYCSVAMREARFLGICRRGPIASKVMGTVKEGFVVIVTETQDMGAEESHWYRRSRCGEPSNKVASE